MPNIRFEAMQFFFIIGIPKKKDLDSLRAQGWYVVRGSFRRQWATDTSWAFTHSTKDALEPQPNPRSGAGSSFVDFKL